MCGGDGKKVTPVPMPNTAVKLLSADGSEGFPFVRVGRCRASIKKVSSSDDAFFLTIFLSTILLKECDKKAK